MPTYNLFISHSWTYSDAYQKLLALLSNADRFSYKNYSVPRDDPIHKVSSTSALRAAIRQQMQPASVVLVLAGVYSSYSKWIDEEIYLAHTGFTVRKPVIAIEPWGSERTSKVVKDNADQIVKWNTGSIVSAIRALA